MPALTGFRKDEAKNRTQVRKDQGSPGGSPYRHAKCRKMGGLGHYKNSFFRGSEKYNFAKVVKRAWVLV
jgi:hypothetical protein